MLHFKYPHDCIVGAGREESNENMHRMYLDEFTPEQRIELISYA